MTPLTNTPNSNATFLAQCSRHSKICWCRKIWPPLPRHVVRISKYTWCFSVNKLSLGFTIVSMAIQVVEFSNGGYKIRKIFAHTQRRLLNFEFWIIGELSKSAKIWLSKSIFYIKNNPNLSLLFSLKNTNSGAHFFDEINFWITLLQKRCPIFDSSPLIQNSRFNDFLWVCWFWCKNLSNFVSPAWKLHNP